MELFLAILMWLGILVVGPFLLWFIVFGTIAGVNAVRRRSHMAQARTQLAQTVAAGGDGGISFAGEVCAIPGGEGVRTCVQCGVCSGSCPNADFMDYSPRKMIAMVRAGMREQVLSSNSMWYCLSCYLCTVRCPRGIKPTDVMYALKQLAIQHGFSHGPTDAPIMYRTFVDAINGKGRVHELGLMRKFYLQTNVFKALGMLSVGLSLLRRRRMPLTAKGIKGAAEVRTIIETARMLEHAPPKAETAHAVEAASASPSQELREVSQ